MFRPTLVKSALAVCILAFTAFALAETLDFNVPSGALKVALDTYVKQAGVQLVYKEDDIRGLRTRGVSGPLSPEEALSRLLEGTQLMAHRDSSGAIAIVQTANSAATGAPSFANAGSMRLVAARAGQHGAAQTQERSSAQGSQAKSPSAPTEDAQGSTIQEVIVTAQKRSERVQDVPLSIAVLSSDDIDRRGLVHAEDYLRGIPGVNQVAGSYGQSIIIRGMETGLNYQNYSTGSTTASYFGETPTSASAGVNGTNVDIKLVDIERVEVLRGPQGTAFGNSSMGGAVRTIPVAPRLDRFAGKLNAGYSATSGTGGTNHQFEAVGNVPIIADKLALRAVAYAFSDSGFYRNRAGSDAAFQATRVAPYGAQAFATDEDEVGAYYSSGGRASALFQASDNLRFTFNYLTQKNETDGQALQNSGTYQQTVLRVAPEHVKRGQTGGLYDFRIRIANAVVEYDLGWSSLLATYSNVDGGSDFVVPWTSYGGTVQQYPVSRDATTSNSGDVGEIRLATKFEGVWNFLAGVYAEEYDDKYSIPNDIWYGDPATNIYAPGTRILSSFFDRRTTKQKAAFGEVAWKFLPRWTLTGGVRAFSYDRSVQTDTSGPLFAGGASTGNKTSDSGVNYRGNLSFKPADNALVYAGWSQGFRLGRPRPKPPAALCDIDGNGIADGTNISLDSVGVVESDSVDSYELGGKFSLFDRRVAVDAAAFRMDWSGLPVLSRLPCTWTFTPNVGSAQSDGVELQANVRVADTFRIGFGGSYVHARITEDAPVAGFRAGDRLPGSPKVNANLSLQHDLQILGRAVSLRADAIYVGDYFEFVGERAFTESGDYVKVDAAARIAIDHLNVDVFVRNLTNEDAFTSRGVFFPVEQAGYRLRPRTVGLQLNYSF